MSPEAILFALLAGLVAVAVAGVAALAALVEQELSALEHFAEEVRDGTLGR